MCNMCNMEKETILVFSKTYERSATFGGTLFHYKNLNTDIRGSFKDDLLSFYEEKFNVVFMCDKSMNVNYFNKYGKNN